MHPTRRPGRPGRPRFRPIIQRLTVELDRQLFAAVEEAAGEQTLRAIVEEALRLWLARQAADQQEGGAGGEN